MDVSVGSSEGVWFCPEEAAGGRVEATVGSGEEPARGVAVESSKGVASGIGVAVTAAAQATARASQRESKKTLLTFKFWPFWQLLILLVSPRSLR